MKLRFDESQIRYYADKYLVEELRRYNNSVERYDNPIERIVNDVKGRGYLIKSDLIALSNWTGDPRNKLRIEKNSSISIEEITRIALSPDTAEPGRINSLQLYGVGPTIASAILHWFHKDCYPIWSKPARYSVHLDKSRDEPKPEEWQAYVSFCRCLAKKNKVNMRTLDRALWKYGKHRGA